MMKVLQHPPPVLIKDTRLATIGLLKSSNTSSHFRETILVLLFQSSSQLVADHALELTDTAAQVNLIVMAALAPGTNHLPAYLMDIDLPPPIAIPMTELDPEGSAPHFR
jgi:hypothetical protein